MAQEITRHLALAFNRRCNSVREYICWYPIAECLAWPRIELARDPIQLSLCVAGEVDPWWDRAKLAKTSGILPPVIVAMNRHLG